MRRLLSFAPWLFLALGIAPLLVWACMGFSVRYLADDYSTSVALLEKGFWPVQTFWYQSWSGRYSFTFIVSLVELAGISIVPWLPMLALTAWFWSLFWVLKQIFTALAISIEKKWLAILATAMIFGTVKSLPAYTEVIFWQTGILTYQISNILFCITLALFLKRFFSQPETHRVALWEYCSAFLIALVLGGFSETWVVIQVALLTLTLLYFAFFYKGHNRSDILRILSTAYVASWLAFMIIVKSPGNLGRTSRMAGISLESIFGALIASIKDAPIFLADWVNHNTALVVVLFITGMVAGFLALNSADVNPAKARAHLWLGLSLLVAATSLLSAGFFPAFVVWGMRPVDRAIFMPLFLFIWVFVLAGVFVGRFLATQISATKPGIYVQSFLLIVLTLMMFWVQARVTLVSLQLIPTLQTYARLWDERDAFLRTASTQKKGHIVVPSLRQNPALHDIHDTIWITGELLEDRRNWINRVASDYYGVKSISGK